MFRFFIPGIACLLALGCKPKAVETTPEPVAPVLIEKEQVGPRFIDAYVETNHGCAIERGGKLWCWGEDPAKRLAMREPTEQWHQASLVAGLEPAIAVDGDRGTTCILLAEGRVRCWQIPTRSRPEGLTSELVPTVEDAVALVVDLVRVCVRRSGGEIECSNIRGGDRQQVATNAVDFEVSGGRECSLDAEGGIWCWDSFAKALIADGETKGRKLEQGAAGELLMARIPGAVEIDVGDSGGDVLVRLKNGEVRIEPTIGFDTPLPATEYLAIAGITDAEIMAFGEGHGCVATKAGEVRCFGGNGWAQLGDGSSSAREQAVVVQGIDEVRDVAVSRSLSCALHGDAISCWGTRSVMVGELIDRQRHVALRDVSRVVGDYDRICATTTKGENLCWGSTTRNAPFEEDSGGIFASATPQPFPIPLGPLRQMQSPCLLDEQGLAVCGLMRSAKDEQQCTISPNFDEFHRSTNVLGIGIAQGICVADAREVRCQDADEQPRPVPAIRKPTALIGGYDEVCVIHDGGKVGCFGVNAIDGKPGSTALATDPQLVATQQLLPLPDCYAALDRKGEVRSFCPRVHDAVPTLGEPRLEAITGLTKIVPHQAGLCGITKDHRLACLDTQTGSVTEEFEDVVDVAGTWEHQCVLQRDGVLTCMGINRFGQLGTPPPTVMAQPVAIEFLGP